MVDGDGAEGDSAVDGIDTDASDGDKGAVDDEY